MDRGTIDDARWLLRTFGPRSLGAWFDDEGWRLPPRSRALWSCVLQRPAPSGRPQIPWIDDRG